MSTNTQTAIPKPQDHPRAPFPEENPTRAHVLLEFEIYADDTEKRLAETHVERMLQRFDADKLPIIDSLQNLIFFNCAARVQTRRVMQATLPRDDGRTVTASHFNAATRAQQHEQRTMERFEDAYEKYRAQHAQFEPEFEQLTEEERKAKAKKESDNFINDMRIPIFGLPLHQFPQRIEAITKCLVDLDKENKSALDRGKPQPFKLEIPQTFLPSLSAPLPLCASALNSPSSSLCPSDPSDLSDKPDERNCQLSIVNCPLPSAPAPKVPPAATPPAKPSPVIAPSNIASKTPPWTKGKYPPPRLKWPNGRPK